MKVATTLAGTLMLVSALSLAQTSVKPVRWAEGAPDTTSEVKNDTKVEGLKAGDVHIFVSLAEVKETEYNRVWIQLANHGNAPLSFDPQAAILLNGDKVVKAEVPDKAAKSIQKVGEAKSQELSSAHCNLMQSGYKQSSSACQPTNTQVQMGKQIAQFSSQQAQWVRDNGLTQKEIAAGQEAQGAIVFKKDKKAADYILRIPVGSQVLEFPLSAQNKAPSY